MERTSKHFRKRDAILNCLKSTTCHPGADWIYTRLKPEIPDLSLGTVYRNLAYFKENGQIVSLGTVNGVERFDYNTTPHVHFVCDSCSKVLDLQKLDVPTALCQSAARETGAQVESCWLTFHGECAACKKVPHH